MIGNRVVVAVALAAAQLAHAGSGADARIAWYTKGLHPSVATSMPAPSTSAALKSVLAAAPPTTLFTGSITVVQLPSSLTIGRPGFLHHSQLTGLPFGQVSAYVAGFITCSATSCVDAAVYDACQTLGCGGEHDVAFGSTFHCTESVGNDSGSVVGVFPCSFQVDTATNTISITAGHLPRTGIHVYNAFADYTTGDSHNTLLGGGAYTSCAPFRTDVDALNDAFPDQSGNVHQDPSCPGAEPYASATMDNAIDIIDSSGSFAPETVSPIDQIQHGLTGTWVNPRTRSEGLVFENYASLGLLSIGWFTFDTESGGADHQRWYVLSGDTQASSSRIDLSIDAAYNGNFATQPVTTIRSVGSATLRFSDCNRGVLAYNFYDGRQGAIDVSRFTSNTSCSAEGGEVAEPPLFLLSGNWFDPSTNGQGIQFELNPGNGLLFGVWYTYAPHGGSIGYDERTTTQRWYTMQAEHLGGDQRHLTNVPLYSTTGGVFNDNAMTTTSQVGSVDITFNSCTSATFAYRITSGENAGRSGTINLVRVGPAPAGCDF